MDQIPEQNARDSHFLMVFSVTIGTILAILAVYLFTTLTQLLAHT